MLYTLLDEQATLALGNRLAHILASGMVVYLQGNLGAGKTTLVRGILQQLGYLASVKSPTYTFVESYYLAYRTIHHFDLYRFSSPQEWEDMGFVDLFTFDALCLIEWPEKAASLLPPADWCITLSWASQGRTATISAASTLAKSCLAQGNP